MALNPCVTSQAVDRTGEIPSGLQIHVNWTSFVNEGARDAIKRSLHKLPLFVVLIQTSLCTGGND